MSHKKLAEARGPRRWYARKKLNPNKAYDWPELVGEFNKLVSKIKKAHKVKKDALWGARFVYAIADSSNPSDLSDTAAFNIQLSRLDEARQRIADVGLFNATERRSAQRRWLNLTAYVYPDSNSRKYKARREKVIEPLRPEPGDRPRFPNGRFIPYEKLGKLTRKQQEKRDGRKRDKAGRFVKKAHK